MPHKSIKKIKCKYCNFTDTRDNLIKHIDRKHQDVIPDGFSAEQVVFDIVNHKDGNGICVICHGPTQWNDKTGKYNKLCSDEECRKKMREKAKSNMIRVYGKSTLLNDPAHQAKMLQNRSISGEYTFTNRSIKIPYTGSYEKKFLEFMDKVLEVDPKDIVAPGPTLRYMYEGKEHFWITDFLYIPYNLIIEIKDGGSNPNNRPMESYRTKQVAKETMITDKGVYNYIRLPDNKFEYLLEIFADIKSDLIDYGVNDVTQLDKKTVKIYESAPMSNSVESDMYKDLYIVNYIKDNKDAFAVTSNLASDMFVDLDGEENNPISHEQIKTNIKLPYKVTMSKGKYKKTLQMLRDRTGLDLELLLNNAGFEYKILSPDQLMFMNEITQIPIEETTISGQQETIKRKLKQELNSLNSKLYVLEKLEGIKLP